MLFPSSLGQPYAPQNFQAQSTSIPSVNNAFSQFQPTKLYDADAIKNAIRSGQLKSHNPETPYYLISDQLYGPNVQADPNNLRYFIGDNSYNYYDYSNQYGRQGIFIQDGEYFSGRNREELLTQDYLNKFGRTTLFSDGTSLSTDKAGRNVGTFIMPDQQKDSYYFNTTPGLDTGMQKRNIEDGARNFGNYSAMNNGFVENLKNLGNFTKSVYQWDGQSLGGAVPGLGTNQRYANYDAQGHLVSMNLSDGRTLLDPQGRVITDGKSLYNYNPDGSYTKAQIAGNGMKDKVSYETYDKNGTKISEQVVEENYETKNLVVTTLDASGNVVSTQEMTKNEFDNSSKTNKAQNNTTPQNNWSVSSGSADKPLTGNWSDDKGNQFTWHRTYNTDGTYKQDLKDNTGKITYSANWSSDGKTVLSDNTTSVVANSNQSTNQTHATVTEPTPKTDSNPPQNNWSVSSGSADKPVTGNWSDDKGNQFTWNRSYNADGTFKQDLKDSTGKVTFTATWSADGKTVLK